MSRPALPPDRRKNYTRVVYLYREEYYQIAREAVRRDMRVSEFIRQAVMEKMESERRTSA